ncbi:ribosomal L1 domain-containing protein 1-like [Chenopodium quinoa]|uniref:ribosomal L1 domain-containing protein 1-like n=1 Tax=Chenopodium quinoa TaxID=63459 RepID=UPI000B7832FE|nr:ribosomal L1 domain-containing protein 1-like [Chenopodium quinoa]
MESIAPPLKVSIQAIQKAVDALLKWKSSVSDSEKPQLLPSDEFLYLVLTLNKIPPKNRINAHKIALPNALYTPESSEFCLFVHDSVSKTAKLKVEEGGVPVSKVIKLSKLKKDYKAFEQKRKLCDSFDLFFADKRIIPLLPNAIGKQFYKKKKIPVPIELGRGNWKEQIERVCSSAMLYLSTGTCSVIKVAKGSMSRDEIVANVVAAVNGVAETVPKKWGNVRGFHLKFSESLALPVYQKVPDLGLKISGLIAAKDANGEEKAVISKKRKEKLKEKVSKKKGRIHEVRYMDSVESGGMVGGDESGSEVDDDVEEEEVMPVEDVVVSGEEVAGKKRKKRDKKEVKKVAKLKKGVKGLKEKKDKLSSKSSEKKSKKIKV